MHEGREPGERTVKTLRLIDLELSSSGKIWYICNYCFLSWSERNKMLVKVDLLQVDDILTIMTPVTASNTVRSTFLPSYPGRNILLQSNINFKPRTWAIEIQIPSESSHRFSTHKNQKKKHTFLMTHEKYPAPFSFPFKAEKNFYKQLNYIQLESCKFLYVENCK